MAAQGRPLAAALDDKVDLAVDDLLMSFDALMYDYDVTPEDMTAAVRAALRKVDLEDAWTDWLESADR